MLSERVSIWYVQKSPLSCGAVDSSYVLLMGKLVLRYWRMGLWPFGNLYMRVACAGVVDGDMGG